MPVSNLTALCFTLGYQGGTIHQIAYELGISPQEIINADENKMEDILRIAQKVRRDRDDLISAR